MNHRPLMPGIAAAISMLILILDSQTTLTGAKEGMLLCVNAVIPSLFPFILLSTVLSNVLSGVTLPLLRPLAGICGIPDGAEALLIPGFLGGYPVGAQTITSAWKAGSLSKEDAHRMLTFCSNAGPSFLFGMCGSVFSDPLSPWILWGVHIVSAILTARCFPVRRRCPVKLKTQRRRSLSDSLNVALRIMAAICGWVILFRVGIAFANRWFLWLLPETVQVIFIGLMELSNGCCSLLRIADEELRFILCSGILACGGLCVVMQTLSVTKGLSIKPYLLGKGLQLLFSLILSTAIVHHSLFFAAPIAVFSLIAFCKIQNKSSILREIGV